MYYYCCSGYTTVLLGPGRSYSKPTLCCCDTVGHLSSVLNAHLAAAMSGWHLGAYVLSLNKKLCNTYSLPPTVPMLTSLCRGDKVLIYINLYSVWLFIIYSGIYY